MLTEKQKEIEKILKEIEHPEISSTLFDLGMLENIDFQESKVSLTLKLPMLQIPIKDYLIDNIKSTLIKKDENIAVEINIEEMDEKERARFMEMAQESWR